MIFEKIIEIAKYYDWESIFRGSLKMLALRLQCSTQELKPLVYLFISAVLDYAVWENAENTQMQLEFIYSVFMKNINAATI